MEAVKEYGAEDKDATDDRGGKMRLPFGGDANRGCDEKDADEISRAVNDLVTLRVDVIMTTGTPASLAAKRATSSIPIVATNMADPVADGLVASLSRPGGDLTGNTFL